MFFDISIKDVIDVLLVAVSLYYLYKLMKESGSLSVFTGILIFILLSLLVSLIKTYCAAKTMIKHKIDDLSLLKVHTYNVLYEKLLFAFAYRNRSTIYQVFKELLGEIALCCKRSNPSQRDRLLIKDLPLLLWQIVNQPGFKRKIS